MNTEGGKMLATEALTKEQLATIICRLLAHQGVEDATILRSDMERTQEEVELYAKPLNLCIILNVIDKDIPDTDATDDSEPGDDFPTPLPPSDLPHSH